MCLIYHPIWTPKPVTAGRIGPDSGVEIVNDHCLDMMKISNAWNRHPDDIHTSEKANVTVSLISKETGTFAIRGKKFNFLSAIYRTYYPYTTPRYHGVDTYKGKKIFVEYTFHPDCSNGCIYVIESLILY